MGIMSWFRGDDDSKKKPRKRTASAKKKCVEVPRKKASPKASTRKSNRATAQVKHATAKTKKAVSKGSKPKEDVSVKLLPAIRFSRAKLIKTGQYRKGKVTKIKRKGVLVELDSGDTGLVQIANLSWRQCSVKEGLENGDAEIEGFNIGDEVSVKVLEIMDDGKIDLGIKQTQCQPSDAELKSILQNVPSVGKAPDNRNSGMECNLTDFAYVPFERYEDLANQTLEEDWTVSKDSPWGVLKSYIRYTFQRAMETGVVSFADDKSAAIFNTGLVDKNYDGIYGYFVPNTKDGARQKWFLNGFFTPGVNGLGKHAIQKFEKMPERVEWLKPERVYFNSKFTIYPNFEHIVFERIERLPMDFLGNVIQKDSKLCDIYNDIEKCQSQSNDLHKKISSTVEKLSNSKYKRIFKHCGMSAFVKFIQKNEDKNNVDKLPKLARDYLATKYRQKELYIELQEELKTPECDTTRYEIVSQLKKAVDLAKKKTLWDYATAVPIYYPTKKEFGFLLPLCLFGQKHVDVALVVSNGANGTYQGQTILTPEMAYSNARLLRRPDAQWLHQWVNGGSVK